MKYLESLRTKKLDAEREEERNTCQPQEPRCSMSFPVIGDLLWCNVHGRRIHTLIYRDGNAEPSFNCDNGRGGIMMACTCTDLTGLVEITK